MLQQHIKTHASFQQVKEEHGVSLFLSHTHTGGGIRVGWYGDGQREGLNHHRNLWQCWEKQQKEVEATEVTTVNLLSFSKRLRLWGSGSSKADGDCFCFSFETCQCVVCVVLLWLFQQLWAIWSKSPPGTGKPSVQQLIAAMQVFMSLMQFPSHDCVILKKWKWIGSIFSVDYHRKTKDFETSA